MSKSALQQRAEELNLIRVSVRFTTCHDDVKISVWATPQEWLAMKTKLHPGPSEGFVGNYFTIPCGVQVTALTREL